MSDFQTTRREFIDTFNLSKETGSIDLWDFFITGQDKGLFHLSLSFKMVLIKATSDNKTAVINSGQSFVPEGPEDHDLNAVSIDDIASDLTTVEGRVNGRQRLLVAAQYLVNQLEAESNGLKKENYPPFKELMKLSDRIVYALAAVQGTADNHTVWICNYYDLALYLGLSKIFEENKKDKK